MNSKAYQEKRAGGRDRCDSYSDSTGVSLLSISGQVFYE